ncbi:sugar-binding transcriptional regulator [Caldicellulosiruptoraceae bacterium PP1]
MNDNIDLIRKIAPEILPLIEKRYDILNTIRYYQPIGRRLLAEKLGIGERNVRNEIENLKSMGLVTITENGMYIVPEVEDIIENLSHIVYDIKGLVDVQKEVKSILQAKDVFIVPGDADKNPLVLKEIGKLASKIILPYLSDIKTIAVTGGTTVKEVVDSFPKLNYKNILVVPARGGIGQEVEKQANTLASELAKKIGGSYKLLHLPDNMDEEVYKLIIKQKDIIDVLNDINRADMLLFGIGNAIEMAKRRRFDDSLISILNNVGAIGEIFGYYYNKNREIVYSTTTIGIKLETLKNIKYMIGVAGGKHKAQAILSLGDIRYQTIFVIDEGIAEEIIRYK